MISHVEPHASCPRSLAIIGNHLPRQCGIATFTSDLLRALAAEATGTECGAVVMNDRAEGAESSLAWLLSLLNMHALVGVIAQGQVAEEVP